MGRKATKISIDELKEIILKKMQKSDDGEDYTCIKDIERFSIYGLRDVCKKVDKDLEKINFDSENFTCEPEEFVDNGGKLVGYHTLDNGLAFVGCMSGGDWETPIFFIIYFDGKDLRGYIPEDGNIFNPLFKCACGSENDGMLSKYPNGFTTKDKKNILEAFPQAPESEVDELIKISCGKNYWDFKNDPGEIAKYMDKWTENLKYDWDKIEADIKGRIEVI